MFRFVSDRIRKRTPKALKRHARNLKGGLLRDNAAERFDRDGGAMRRRRHRQASVSYRQPGLIVIPKTVRLDRLRENIGALSRPSMLTAP